jgi:hypothetical protein
MDNVVQPPSPVMSHADALLTGSVPLYSAQEVINYCGGGLGDVAVGIPDGEVGDRSLWIIFQAYRIFDGHPQLVTTQRPQPSYNWRPSGLDDMWLFSVRDRRENLTFDDLQYARNAEESYKVFEAAKAAGTVPANARFQVRLPLPESGCSWFFPDVDDLGMVVPAYEAALHRELRRILDIVSGSELTIQWDVCWEVLDIEGAFPWTLPGKSAFERFADACGRMSANIPEEVLLGYHFCYADLGHRHMMEPVDLSLSVRMSNAAAENSGRRVDFTHMAVPINRDDKQYFAPLAELHHPGPKVFLGLIHYSDGLDGAMRRAAVASEFLPDFGVATECGWGRRPAWQVPELITLHRRVIEGRAG